MFTDAIKNTFNKDKELPSWSLRIPVFDARLLVDEYGLPDFVRASNGRSYVYFNYKPNMNFAMLKQMGFNPKMHFSRYSFPAHWVCRFPIGRGTLSKPAESVVKELMGIARNRPTAVFDPKMPYDKYVARYKPAFFEKTR